MSAVDKIIEGILRQANARAEEILAQAHQRAAEILEKGEADRAGRKRQLDDALERECREILSRAQSADRQSRRLTLLELRNQVLDEVIVQAKAKLAGYPPERFGVVESGGIILNNTLDAIFEADRLMLRDTAYAVLRADR